MKQLIQILSLLIISSVAIAQPACVTFSNTNSTFTSPTSDDAIIYSEAGIDFRYIKGDDILGTPNIIIDALTQWSGINGSDNFSGNRLFWGWAESHILFNNLSLTNKKITIDLNSYNGDKFIPTPMTIWAQGAYNVSFDTTSLTNGTIVTITGNVDSMKMGAYNHNDYVIDNVCVTSFALDLKNTTVNNSLQLYPNPSNTGTIKIDTDLKEASYSIYSLEGKKVMTDKLNAINTIDISALTLGHYIVELNGGELIQKGHFIKQ